MDDKWRQVEDTDEDIRKYYSLVTPFTKPGDYYLTQDVNFLRNEIRSSHPTEFWIYEDGDKKMTFAIKWVDDKWNPFQTVTETVWVKERKGENYKRKEITHNKAGMWRVMDCTYSGPWGNMHDDGFSLEASKYLVQSARQRCDELGIRYTYAHMTTKVHDGKTYVQKFNETLRNSMWEAVDLAWRPDGYHIMLHFDRDPSKQPPDERKWVRTTPIPERQDLQEGDL
jgi:hypothetical protein